MKQVALVAALLFATAVLASELAYPNNPECGWGYETYRAVGDWAVDAGAATNWDRAEPRGVMTPTGSPCLYQVTLHNLQPGMTYNWKVTIHGERTEDPVTWGCYGWDGASCQFTADNTGSIILTIQARDAFELTSASTSRIAYPNNPECGWGYEIFRAIGDWAVDAGAATNWDRAEPRGGLIPTGTPCQYAWTMHGLQPGKEYNWQVTIHGERTEDPVTWGCYGWNGASCQFTADSTGSIILSIDAQTSYTLTSKATPQPVPATLAYPNNPECGWGYETYRAVGDWAVDAGAATNWNPAEPLAVMTPTGAPCLYQLTIAGLQAGKVYNWKVTIMGEKTGFDTNWGCIGFNAPNCQFTADSTGGIILRIQARDSYELTSASTLATTSSSVATSSTYLTTSTPAASTSATATTTPGPVPKNDKYVFAHYMMGYAYGSDQAFFNNTIAIAQSVGIDGFAVNVGVSEWQLDRMTKFLAAAAARSFKLFISFDMNEIDNRVDVLDNWVNTFADHPAYFRYNGRPFVSTFAGQDKTLTIGSAGNDAWTKWKTGSTHVGAKNIYFCPNFFGDLAGNYNTYPVMDCLFSWDAWGAQSSNSRDVSAISAGHAQGKQYMTGVAPWFYCHLPQYSKNWFWPQGQSEGSEHLYVTRWNQAIASDTDFVEIVTWNDYSESSYIAPLSQEVPDFAANYVNGLPHSGWLHMTKYYANLFKNGKCEDSKPHPGQGPKDDKPHGPKRGGPNDNKPPGPPGQGPKDDKPPHGPKDDKCKPPGPKAINTIYWSYRPHLLNAVRNDTKPRPTFYWTPSDCVAVHAISANPGADVTVNIGGRVSVHKVVGEQDSWCVPFGGTGAVSVSVKRGPKVTNGVSGPAIQNGGNTYIFNPFSGYVEYN